MGAAAGPSSCASWCDEQTCNAAECRTCDNPKCIPDRPGCASWCKAPAHCGLADCISCNDLNDPAVYMNCEKTASAAPVIAGCASWCSDETCDADGCEPIAGSGEEL